MDHSNQFLIKDQAISITNSLGSQQHNICDALSLQTEFCHKFITKIFFTKNINSSSGESCIMYLHIPTSDGKLIILKHFLLQNKILAGHFEYNLHFVTYTY